MKVFSLAGLLRVRSLEETLAAAGLADAHRSLGGVRARRASTTAALAGTTTEAAGAASLAAIAATRAAAQSMLSDLSALDASARHDVDEAVLAHRAARRASRSIERLHDRFDQQSRALDLRQEQSTLDEIAVTRWQRGEGEGS